MDDDPILESFDLYTNKMLAGYLHIVQYAGGTTDSRVSMDDGEPVQVRFKEESGLLEMRLPLQVDRSTYSLSKATDLLGSPQLDQTERPSPLSSYLLSGFPMHLSGEKSSGFDDYGNPIAGSNKAHCDFFVCRRVSGDVDGDIPSAIYMTPVNKFITLRPHLDYIDEADLRAKQSARRSMLPSGSVDASVPTEGLKTVNVTSRRRETSEQIQARLSSFAHLQKKISEETWNEAMLINCANQNNNLLPVSLCSDHDVPVQCRSIGP